MLKQLHETISNGKGEMAFLLFTNIDGKLLRNQIIEKYKNEDEDESTVSKIFEEAKGMRDTVLEKLETFVRDNTSRMDRGASHKQLTLLLNPLAESIKLCGSYENVSEEE